MNPEFVVRAFALWSECLVMDGNDIKEEPDTGLRFIENFTALNRIEYSCLIKFCAYFFKLWEQENAMSRDCPTLLRMGVQGRAEKENKDFVFCNT